MQYKREISDKIRAFAGEFPVIILTGARQVGKTTLLRELFPTYEYVSLDIPSTAQMASENPDLFLKKYPPPLIIDEIQYAPGVFRHLKVWVDQHRELKGQIILTGSQKFNLMKEVSESLAGRVGVLEMEPLSVFELRQHERLSNEDHIDMMVRGFYPELWKEKQRSAAAFYQSYLNTYLERDVRQIVNVVNLLDFEKFLRLLATRAGQTVEKSTLAKDVGVKVNTINSWLSVLEASNQIIFLQPYFENFGSRVIKSPKLYFSDVGLCLFLLGLERNSLVGSPIVGSIWENLVFLELRKRNLCRAMSGQFWYYRDSQAREVDIIFVSKGKVHFIETKWTTQPDEKAALKLMHVSGLLKSRVVKKGSLTILSRSEDQYRVKEDVITSSLFDFELPD